MTKDETVQRTLDESFTALMTYSPAEEEQGEIERPRTFRYRYPRKSQSNQKEKHHASAE